MFELEVREYQNNSLQPTQLVYLKHTSTLKNGDFVAPLAVYDNDAIIGFVMIAYDKRSELVVKIIYYFVYD